ncbi:hypothetical protein FI667_g11273, partial [Globisporangium splendens]
MSCSKSSPLERHFQLGSVPQTSLLSIDVEPDPLTLFSLCMNIELLEEDHIATLDEVLAYIDNNYPSSDDSSESAVFETAHHEHKTDNETVCNDVPNQRQRHEMLNFDDNSKKKQLAAKPRTRYKSQILQLRDLVVDLEARLVHLQRIRLLDDTSKTSTTSSGHTCSTTARSENSDQDVEPTSFETVIAEYKRLQLARRRNRQLRKALTERVNVHKQIERLLFTQRVLPETSNSNTNKN